MRPGGYVDVGGGSEGRARDVIEGGSRTRTIEGERAGGRRRLRVRCSRVSLNVHESPEEISRGGLAPTHCDMLTYTWPCDLQSLGKVTYRRTDGIYLKACLSFFMLARLSSSGAPSHGRRSSGRVTP